LGIVVETAERLQRLLQGILARMTEGRMAEIVHQSDALGEILIELQRAGERTGDLRHLDRMCQARAIVVAVGGDKNLRLVLQATEGRRVDDTVAVSLEIRTRRALRLRKEPPARRPGVGSIDGSLSRAETQRLSIQCHSSPAFAAPIDAASMPSYL